MGSLKKQANDYQIIHIKRISVSPAHVRKTMPDVSGLKRTISDVGLLQPILVRQMDRGYTVIDGALRLEALKELGVQELIIGKDVIVVASETEADETFKQLIANIQREDINDIELGYAFVILKEKYCYAYKEMAEIIGKTPHYVAAKVGLAKRLIPEVQALVIEDREEAKRCQKTIKEESNDVLDPYVMNVNVIEDIARLPAELQMSAYQAIRDKEMDKKEALKYLKGIKLDAGVLQKADDVKGLMQNYADDEKSHASDDVKKFIKKIDKDFERLFETIKSAGPADQEKLIPELESLIERLNMIYSEIKAGKDDNRALAICK